MEAALPCSDRVCGVALPAGRGDALRPSLGSEGSGELHSDLGHSAAEAIGDGVLDPVRRRPPAMPAPATVPPAPPAPEAEAKKLSQRTERAGSGDTERDAAMPIAVAPPSALGMRAPQGRPDAMWNGNADALLQLRLLVALPPPPPAPPPRSSATPPPPPATEARAKVVRRGLRR